MQDVPIILDYQGKQFLGFAVPLPRNFEAVPTAFDIIIDKAFLGTLRRSRDSWSMDPEMAGGLVPALGQYIDEWYDQSSGRKEAYRALTDPGLVIPINQSA